MASPTSPLSAEQLEQLRTLIDSQTAAVVTPPAQVQQVQQPQEPQPLTFQFGGVEYTARDQAELQRIMAQVDQARNSEYEAARLREEAARQRQPDPRTATDGFDKEEYAKLFLDDPRKANRYAMQHDPEQIRFYTNLVSQVETLKQESAAQQFLLANPDYERNPANFRVLEGIMRQYNLPPDANGFSLAFITAKQSGLIADNSQAAHAGAVADASADELRSNVVPITAPPRLKKGGRGTLSDDSDVMSRFESLTPEQMKQFLLAQS